jgi:hypothetical protein
MGMEGVEEVTMMAAVEAVVGEVVVGRRRV